MTMQDMAQSISQELYVKDTYLVSSRHASALIMYHRAFNSLCWTDRVGFNIQLFAIITISPRVFLYLGRFFSRSILQSRQVDLENAWRREIVDFGIIANASPIYIITRGFHARAMGQFSFDM